MQFQWGTPPANLQFFPTCRLKVGIQLFAISMEYPSKSAILSDLQTNLIQACNFSKPLTHYITQSPLIHHHHHHKPKPSHHIKYSLISSLPVTTPSHPSCCHQHQHHKLKPSHRIHLPSLPCQQQLIIIIISHNTLHCLQHHGGMHINDVTSPSTTVTTLQTPTSNQRSTSPNLQPNI